MAIFFEVNGTRLPFPSDNMDVVESKRLLSQQYPMLRNTTVYPEDAQISGEDIIYPVVLPPAKTKG
jgi:hypothetical protein